MLFFPLSPPPSQAKADDVAAAPVSVDIATPVDAVPNVVAIAMAAPGPKVAMPAPKATPVPAITPAPIELWSISLIFLFSNSIFLISLSKFV